MPEKNHENQPDHFIQFLIQCYFFICTTAKMNAYLTLRPLMVSTCGYKINKIKYF